MEGPVNTPFITAPGIYPDLTMPDYHSGTITPTPAMSSSIAALMNDRCPAAVWHAHPALNPDFVVENKREFDLGSAAHLDVLEPDRFDAETVVIDADSYRTKIAQESRDMAYAAGKTPLLTHQHELVLGMCHAVMGNDTTRDLLYSFGPTRLIEQSLFWIDTQTGVWCKSRPDLMIDHGDDSVTLVNYKTHGRSIEPNGFARHVADMAYYQRAAWEIEAVHRVLGKTVRRYLLLAQEIDPPYLSAVYRLMPSDLAYGNGRNRWALDQFAGCLGADHWPGYSDTAVGGIMDLPLPGYVQMRLETQRVEREIAS